MNLNQACLGGTCGAYTTVLDCCAPLVCVAGIFELIPAVIVPAALGGEPFGGWCWHRDEGRRAWLDRLARRDGLEAAAASESLVIPPPNCAPTTLVLTVVGVHMVLLVADRCHGEPPGVRERTCKASNGRKFVPAFAGALHRVAST